MPGVLSNQYQNELFRRYEWENKVMDRTEGWCAAVHRDGSRCPGYAVEVRQHTDGLFVAVCRRHNAVKRLTVVPGAGVARGKWRDPAPD